MSKNPLSIAPGVIIEHVGDEVVVFTSESSETIKLSGPVAQTVVAIQAGKAIDASATGVSDLMELGIIRSAGMSRRGLITAGAVGAGAGIAMLSMPAAAAAGSANKFAVESALWDAGGGSPIFFQVFFNPVPPAGTPDPSPITVTRDGAGSFSAQFVEFSDRGPFALWEVPSSDVSPALSGPVQGTFTLDEEPYTVTFDELML
jgi:hypothetical protein